MSGENVVEKEKAKNLKSLKDFIDDYQKTIAVIGVFIALGLFWKTIYHTTSIPYVSYLCFLITIPLLFEVRKGFDHNSSSWNLVIFMDAFQGIIFFTILSLITDYPEHFEKIIGGIILTSCFFVSGYFTDKVGKYIKNRAYLKAVKYAEEVHEMDIPIDNRNRIVTLKNEILQSFYSLINAFQFIGLALSVVIALALFPSLNKYLDAIFDLTYSRKLEFEIEAPNDLNINSDNKTAQK